MFHTCGRDEMQAVSPFSAVTVRSMAEICPLCAWFMPSGIIVLVRLLG